MRLTGIHHVSILVTDMARSVAFYSGPLGLREVPRPSNFTTQVRWFVLGDQQLHLIPSPEADSVSPRHFALHVEDCDGARMHCRRHGIEPRETTPIAGADRFFISDPDGNNIEIVEWRRHWDENSERELGIPDNGDRRMLAESELPSPLPLSTGA